MEILPKVSVIVPVYNAGKKLVPSIESLLNQTLKDIEIIIVNDASTDDSGTIIDNLARENSNIVPVHFSENKGVHEARLAGLKKSTAPWIGFLDADDFARPNMFESMLSAGIKEGVDVVICGSYRVNTERKLIRKRSSFKQNAKIKDKIFERFCNLEFGDGALWNKLYKRKIITKVFFYEYPWRQNINEDMVVNLGVFSNAKSVYIMKDMLHESVENTSSVTAKMNIERAYVETYRAYALAIHVYKYFNDKERFMMTSLYSRQLEGIRCTSIELLNISHDYQKEINEAINVIIHVYPKGAALLSCRSSNLSYVSGRALLNALFIKIPGYLKKTLGLLVSR